MILDLLRHGETEQGGLRGSLDDALTDKGWAQMRQAVAEAGPWEVLVSSPLQRCARFAEELGERLNLAAIRMGLGVSGIGGFFDDQVNELLGIPDREAVLYITTLGRPARRT